MIEPTRRRILHAINVKYLQGHYSIINLGVLLVELFLMARIFSKFNLYYSQRPILTTMVTNAILGGVADSVAQTITSIRQSAVRRGLKKDDTLAIALHEMDKKNPVSDQYLIPNSALLPPPFDFERLARFMTYGFVMAPLQFKWFQWLSKTFPVNKNNVFSSAMKRMAVDQLFFAPIGVALFFSIMTLAEGGGRKAISRKLKDMYFPTLKANYMLWPLVQIINFRLMPIQFQLPFVSSVGIAWTAYLSLSNAAEDVTKAQSASSTPAIRLS